MRRKRDPEKNRVYARNTRARKPKEQCYDCTELASVGPRGCTLFCDSCSKKRAIYQRTRLHNFDTEDEARYSLAESCDWCRLPFDATESPYVDHDHACCPTSKHCYRCTRGFVHQNCNLHSILYEEWLETKFDITTHRLRLYRAKFPVPREER
jgi:hypothetical protein